MDVGSRLRARRCATPVAGPRVRARTRCPGQRPRGGKTPHRASRCRRPLSSTLRVTAQRRPRNSRRLDLLLRARLGRRPMPPANLALPILVQGRPAEASTGRGNGGRSGSGHRAGDAADCGNPRDDRPEAELRSPDRDRATRCPGRDATDSAGNRMITRFVFRPSGAHRRGERRPAAQPQCRSPHGCGPRAGRGCGSGAETRSGHRPEYDRSGSASGNHCVRRGFALDRGSIRGCRRAPE